MTRTLSLAIAVAALFLGGVSSLAQDAEVPDLLYSPIEPEVVVWVSADAALTDSGALRRDHLPNLSYRWEQMATRGSIAEKGCLSEGMTIEDPLPHMVPVRSLDQLFAFSLGVVLGTVAGTEPGFFEQHPALLVRLDPAETIAGDVTAESGPLYVHYPSARFQVGSFSFCKDDPRLPHTPQVGDQILAFVRTGAHGERAQLVVPLADDIFIETAEGKLIAPIAFEDDPVVATARSIEEILASLPSPGGD